MYAISEEDSFLPAIISSNPVKQLEQVRGFYERQREFSLLLDRNLDEIRMAYCRKLCTEKARQSKSLWELEVRKSRFLHKIMEPKKKKISEWKLSSNKQLKKQHSKQMEKGRRKVESQFKTSKVRETVPNNGRHSKQKLDDDGNEKQVEKLEIPKFLLRWDTKLSFL